MSKRSLRFLPHYRGNNSNDNNHNLLHPQPPHSGCCISSSKDETILVSSCGDVVVCRCRDSSFPYPTRSPSGRDQHNTPWDGYHWEVAEQVADLCCETNCEDLTNQLQGAAFCGSSWNLVGDDLASPAMVKLPDSRRTPPPPSPFRRTSTERSNGTMKGGGGGLLGGNPADVATQFLHHPQPSSPSVGGLQGGGSYFKEADPTFQQKAAVAFRSPPLRHTSAVDDHNNDGAVAALVDDECSSIVPIRSFDYTHFFADNGNDMIPDTPRRNKQQSSSSFLIPNTRAAAPGDGPTPFDVVSPSVDDVIVSYSSKDETFYHGIPTFPRAFASVRITKCSAHPLGSHVLLISAPGLLYSYGLNDCGQLGIGVKTRVSGFHRGYITTPTIVTPLVENGGKAIACAAGVNHSLVVVETEERRIVKSRSFDPPPSSSSSHAVNCSNNTVVSTASSRSVEHPPSTRPINVSSSTTETVVYHQVYGFGKNDSLKIGLISPRVALINGMDEEVEAVVLPRRVALRCRVSQPQYEIPLLAAVPPRGIFDIQASAEHSCALVHRDSGDIELYTWGNATFGALGCTLPKSSVRSPISTSSIAAAPASSSASATASSSPLPINVVPVPSFVASLSLSDNEEAQASSLLLDGEFPLSASLGRKSSFVLTSFGRCFAFGTSDEGMLGLGPKITEALKPSEIALPAELRGEGLVRVGAGASHVLACTESGRVLAWGSKVPAGLAIQRETPANSTITTTDNGENASSATTTDTSIQWSPKQVELGGKSVKKQDYKVVHVGAGYDCSILVTESGRVLSCGRHSGRLGLGEVVRRRTDGTAGGRVTSPRPMWGGLRLWHDRDGRRRRLPLKRGATIS